MDNFNLLIAQAMIAQRQREMENVTKERIPAPRGNRGMRHTLASSFVRVGLRLDPAAGEDLDAFDVRTVGQEGGC